ncbi:MAG: FCD domain-containing protein, partial [Gammaproteobacteria bacterium]|nr:FCD domain-containing protein [Gammaproteobacteria bacterium]
LPPGAVVAEKPLIEELGIGRTPIREALQRLAVEGLLHHMPNRGMFVSEISATSVQQIYEFRELIDGYAARLAATRATPEDAEDLMQLHEALVQATEEDDVDRYVALDRAFYLVLARAATNTYLAEVIPRIFNLHLRLWFFIAQKIGSWHPIAE